MSRNVSKRGTFSTSENDAWIVEMVFSHRAGDGEKQFRIERHQQRHYIVLKNGPFRQSQRESLFRRFSFAIFGVEEPTNVDAPETRRHGNVPTAADVREIFHVVLFLLELIDGVVDVDENQLKRSPAILRNLDELARSGVSNDDEDFVLFVSRLDYACIA